MIFAIIVLLLTVVVLIGIMTKRAKESDKLKEKLKESTDYVDVLTKDNHGLIHEGNQFRKALSIADFKNADLGTKILELEKEVKEKRKVITDLSAQKFSLEKALVTELTRCEEARRTAKAMMDRTNSLSESLRIAITRGDRATGALKDAHKSIGDNLKYLDPNGFNEVK